LNISLHSELYVFVDEGGERSYRSVCDAVAEY
jgi:hypothetical protein